MPRDDLLLGLIYICLYNVHIVIPSFVRLFIHSLLCSFINSFVCSLQSYVSGFTPYLICLRACVRENLQLE